MTFKKGFTLTYCGQTHVSGTDGSKEKHLGPHFSATHFLKGT